MRNRWITPALTAAMWAFTLVVFRDLPEQVPTHWGLDGEVDRWSDRSLLAFLLPIVATLTMLLPRMSPKIDPRGASVGRNRDELQLIINLLAAFLLLVHVATLGVALEWLADPTGVIAVGLGFLLIGVGNYLPRLRANWFVGIRTPWTLSSDAVWRVTHRLGGWVFVLAGLIVAATALLPKSSRAWVIVATVVVAAVVPVAYSYMAWRRERSGQPL